MASIRSGTFRKTLSAEERAEMREKFEEVSTLKSQAASTPNLNIE